MNGKRTFGKAAFHQHTGRVLYVDLQVAPMSSERIDAAGNSEKGGKAVELGNMRKHHPTTQIRASRIHVAVILVRMPMGKIFPNRRSDCQRTAENSALHRLGYRAETWTKA